MKVNINPEISPQEAKCFLTIYHDVGLKLDESTNLVVKTFSFGHFYFIFSLTMLKQKLFGYLE